MIPVGRFTYYLLAVQNDLKKKKKKKKKEEEEEEQNKTKTNKINLGTCIMTRGGHSTCWISLRQGEISHYSCEVQAKFEESHIHPRVKIKLVNMHTP